MIDTRIGRRRRPITYRGNVSRANAANDAPRALRLLIRCTLKGESLRAVVELCRVDVALRIDRHLVGPNGSWRAETVVCQHGKRLSIHEHNLIALSDIQELLLFVRRQGETAR